MKKIGKRLKEYRISRDITQKEMAEKLDISPSYLSLIENGKRKIDSELFMKIIENTGIKFEEGVRDYFGIEDKTSIQKFRKKDYHRKVTGTLKKFQDLVKFYSRLEDEFDERINPPRLNLPEYLLAELEKSEDRGIEKIGEFLRKSFSLGMGPLPNINLILDSLGIKIFALPVEKKNVSGSFYFSGETGPAILVNLNEPPGRRAYTAAHELVHYLFDSDKGFIVDENISEVLLDKSTESVANKIASSFLMPEDTLKFYWYRVVNKKPEQYHINILKDIFDVTYSALLFRCVMVDLISFKKYHELKLPRTGDYEKSKRKPFLEGMPRRFLNLLRRGIEEEKITKKETTEILDINSQALNKFLKKKD